MTLAEALRTSGLEPREARLLLAEASGLSQSAIIGFPEKHLSDASESRFRNFTGRRKLGEPVAYILGRKEFYGLDLEVTPAVLIPRPETELLVELALKKSFEKIVDLGTGSGAVALAVKANRPAARVVAVDQSPAALEVARRNAARTGLEIDFRQGHWFEPLQNEHFDLVLANPPYVASADPHLADLAFEPPQALIAGADGLDRIREIASVVRAHLAPGGEVLIEHGAGQDAAVRGLLLEARLETVMTWPDLSGTPRVSGGRR